MCSLLSVKLMTDSANLHLVTRYALVVSAVFATSGLGYMVSMLFQPGSYQMAAAVVVLISSMLDGDR